MPETETYEIHRESLSEQVYYYIKRLILSGEIQGGQRIPEEKVAQQFGVSRTPIREALKRLEEYGLIQIKPRSYAVVVALEPHEAGQLAVIRSSLETLAVGLLTDCGTEEDFKRLDLLAMECNRLIAESEYDMAVFDIMGVRGFELLKKSVSKGFPTVMLTAHALTPDALKESIKSGAVAFLPKEMMAELDAYLADVVSNSRKVVWKNLLDNLSGYFDRQFGANWKETDEFFRKFEEELKSVKEDES